MNDKKDSYTIKEIDRAYRFINRKLTGLNLEQACILFKIENKWNTIYFTPKNAIQFLLEYLKQYGLSEVNKK